jgi:hypothetical protein
MTLGNAAAAGVRLGLRAELPLISATSQPAAFRQKAVLERLYREPIAIRVCAVHKKEEPQR